jgi:hypothetical protein
MGSEARGVTSVTLPWLWTRSKVEVVSRVAARPAAEHHQQPLGAISCCGGQQLCCVLMVESCCSVTDTVLVFCRLYLQLEQWK